MSIKWLSEYSSKQCQSLKGTEKTEKLSAKRRAARGSSVPPLTSWIMFYTAVAYKALLSQIRQHDCELYFITYL